MPASSKKISVLVFSLVLLSGLQPVSAKEMEPLVIKTQDENEIFINGRQNGKQVVTNTDGNKLFRLFYDDFLRIEKKETWYIDSFTTSSVTETEINEYTEDSLYPSKKTISTPSSITILFYTPENNLSQKDEYLIKAGTEDTESVTYKTASTTWKYNDKGKITQEYTKNFIYGEDFTTPASVVTRRNDYKYKNPDENEIPPDHWYYEDDVLRMKTIYSNETDYVVSMYFNKSDSINTYYSNGKKTQEEFFQGGKLIRTKTYEQQ